MLAGQSGPVQIPDTCFLQAVTFLAIPLPQHRTKLNQFAAHLASNVCTKRIAPALSSLAASCCIASLSVLCSYLLSSCCRAACVCCTQDLATACCSQDSCIFARLHCHGLPGCLCSTCSSRKCCCKSTTEQATKRQHENCRLQEQGNWGSRSCRSNRDAVAGGVCLCGWQRMLPFSHHMVFAPSDATAAVVAAVQATAAPVALGAQLLQALLLC